MNELDYNEELKAIKKGNRDFIIQLINLIIIWIGTALFYFYGISWIVVLSLIYTLILNLKVLIWTKLVNTFKLNYDLMFNNVDFTQSIINGGSFDVTKDEDKEQVIKEKHKYINDLINRYKYRIFFTKLVTMLILISFICFVVFVNVN